MTLSTELKQILDLFVETFKVQEKEMSTIDTQLTLRIEILEGSQRAEIKLLKRRIARLENENRESVTSEEHY